MQKKTYIVLLLAMAMLLQAKAVAQSPNDKRLESFVAGINTQNTETAYRILDSLNKLANISPANKVMVMQKLEVAASALQRFDEAAKLCHDGMAIAEKNHLDSAYVSFHNLMGVVHYYVNKFPESLAYFRKSAAMAKEKRLWALEVINYHCIGGVSVDLKQFDTAELYLKRVLAMSQGCTQCQRAKLLALRVLGTLYERQGRFVEAKKQFDKYEPDAWAFKDTTIICSFLTYHANLLSKMGQKEEAVKKAEASVKLMRIYKGGHSISLLTTITMLASKLEDVGRFKEANPLRREAVEISQQRFKEQNIEQVNQLEAKYRLKEIEKEKELAKANLLAEKRKKEGITIALFGVVLLAILIAFIVHTYNKKKKAEEKAIAQKSMLESIMQAEEKERSRIAKDLHDGIVQDLTAIKMDLKSSAHEAPAAIQQQLHSILNDVDAAAKEVREISYQMMPVTLKELGLLQAIQELLNRSLSKNNIQFDFDSFGVEQRLPEKIEVTVYRICQELINNTIKHSGATHVSLLLQMRNNVLQLTYEDNGKGFNTSTIKRGIGLNSLDSRIEMVKGSLEIDVSPGTGTTAYIRIPIAEIPKIA